MIEGSASGCCEQWMQGSVASMEMVRPEGSKPLTIAESESVELTASELLVGSGALKMGSYPLLMYRLPCADPKALKSSLAKALVRHPWFAGRICVQGGFRKSMTGIVALSNTGVPFTVLRVKEASAPIDLEEVSMLSFGHLPNLKKMMKGEDAVMTVKLTLFTDGSAILALARSHGLADGSYTWAFMADWAAASRGKALGDRVFVDKAPWKIYIEDRHELAKVIKEELGYDQSLSLSQKSNRENGASCEMQRSKRKTMLRAEFFGYELPHKWWHKHVMNAILHSMDLVFYAGASKTTSRTRIKLSNADMDHVKEVATPPRGSAGDGWVTTQEAITAHILLSLARAILPPNKTDAVTGVEFWIDLRKLAGVPLDAACGMGFATVVCDVDRLVEKKLWEVASDIHEGLKVAQQSWKRRSGLIYTMAQNGAVADWAMGVMTHEHFNQKNIRYDVHLQLNNQSKRVMPDFGNAGGVPSAVITNAGPSLLLPRSDGVELFLVKDAFMGASELQQAEAVRLISDVKAL